MSKYGRLTDYLANKAQEGYSDFTMNFSEIGDLISGGLPLSALKYSAWWNSSGHSHAQIWETSGFKASPDLSNKVVHWVRLGHSVRASKPPKPSFTPTQRYSSTDEDWVGPDREDSIYLVACVKGKRGGIHRAMDLYDSDFFRKCRAYVESRRCPWFILSAKYGLISPDTSISTYDETLKRMSADEKRLWAARVLKEAPTSLPAARRIVFIAGNDYRSELIQGLADLGYALEIPMEGLGIGEQKSWLIRHTV